MSLLSEAMTPCTMITKSVTTDGYGGYTTAWVDGAEFESAIVFDSSMQARQAAAEGVTSRYTVLTKRDFILKFHDVFRRESDEKIFRVTADGDGKVTPLSASLDKRWCTAAEWKLPQNG